MTKKTKVGLPEGWDDARVSKVIQHYENQCDEDAIAEDEAAFAGKSGTYMQIPKKLLSHVRQLITDAKQPAAPVTSAGRGSKKRQNQNTSSVPAK